MTFSKKASDFPLLIVTRFLNGYCESEPVFIRRDTIFIVEEKVLTAAVQKTVNVCDVFLHSSHAKGEAKRDSDIDTVVVVDQVSEDYLGYNGLLMAADKRCRWGH